MGGEGRRGGARRIHFYLVRRASVQDCERHGEVRIFSRKCLGPPRVREGPCDHPSQALMLRVQHHLETRPERQVYTVHVPLQTVDPSTLHHELILPIYLDHQEQSNWVKAPRGQVLNVLHHGVQRGRHRMSEGRFVLEKL